MSNWLEPAWNRSQRSPFDPTRHRCEHVTTELSSDCLRTLPQQSTHQFDLEASPPRRIVKWRIVNCQGNLLNWEVKMLVRFICRCKVPPPPPNSDRSNLIWTYIRPYVILDQQNQTMVEILKADFKQNFKKILWKKNMRGNKASKSKRQKYSAHVWYLLMGFLQTFKVSGDEWAGYLQVWGLILLDRRMEVWKKKEKKNFIVETVLMVSESEKITRNVIRSESKMMCTY